MDILCLMGLFPSEYYENIQRDSVTGMQNAANKLQWAIVHGLCQIEQIDVSLVNSLYIGSYPKRYKTMKIPTFEFEFGAAKKGLNVGFCNLSGYKWISRYCTTKKAIKRWATDGNTEKKVLLIYALTTPFANVAKYVKKHFPHIKVCIVVPDLPEYMRTGTVNKKSLYWKLKQVEIRMIRKCIEPVDGYVLLTDAMKNWFEKTPVYTVVEGIADGPIKAEELSAPRKKTILYAGGIKEEYGVTDLVQSFIEIGREDWELAIYGDGVDLNRLRDYAKKCPNVKFYGMTPNHIVVEKQKQASILVNPRKNQEFTKYSFPSKILEYMTSGTPVLAYCLAGIPKEYDPYYYHIAEETNGLKNALIRLMNMEERDLVNMGKNAKQFVLKEKNPKHQCQKIVDLLERL